jgi:hypothetical protein
MRNTGIPSDSFTNYVLHNLIIFPTISHLCVRVYISKFELADEALTRNAATRIQTE